MLVGENASAGGTQYADTVAAASMSAAMAIEAEVKWAER